MIQINDIITTYDILDFKLFSKRLIIWRFSYRFGMKKENELNYYV